MKSILKFAAAFGIAFITLMSAWNAMASPVKPEKIIPELVCVSPDIFEFAFKQTGDQGPIKAIQYAISRGLCQVLDVTVEPAVEIIDSYQFTASDGEKIEIITILSPHSGQPFYTYRAVTEL